MKTHSRALLIVRRASICMGLPLAVLSCFYFFSVSAQKDVVQSQPEAPLVNGRLAFSRMTIPGGDRTIHTANSDGTDSLTVAGNYSTEPAWSPDGTQIALVGTISLNEIFVVNANGGAQTNLTNTASATERNPSWSVTGKIAYERSSQIWTMNADGTGQAQFTFITQPAPIAPAWSPDGTKLAFVSGNEIWVINADGTNQTRVTNNASTDSDPAWSPDGSKIVFGKSGTGISVINLDGTNETPLTAGTSDAQPSWSPDGTKIAFKRPSVQGGGIFTMDADGANQIRIVSNATAFPLCCDIIYENPAWQPVAQTPNTYSISGYIRYNNEPVSGLTVDLSGPTKATTTTDAIGYYQFSGLLPGGYYGVSPGAVKHYFAPANLSFFNLMSNQTGHNFEVRGVCVGGRCVRNGKIAYMAGGEIYTINPDGTGQTNITNNAATDGEPNWSPDGARIAFASSRDGGFEIYRMNADGQNPVRLTNNSANDFSPFYSPDGSSIVFISDRDGGPTFEIYKMNADGSNQVRLTTDTIQQSAPTFSPDGSKIVYVSGNVGSASLFIMNSDGSGQQQLSPPGGISPDYERPSYSPDGSKLIFTYTPDASTTLRATYTMNADGTNRVQFPAAGRMGSYSPDGTKVVYHCCQFDNTNRLRTSNADGSTSSVKFFSSSATPVDVADWQPIRVPRAPVDFDGDGRSDISLFRPAGGLWYQIRSMGNVRATAQWGLSTDVITPADYDGDLKTDLAVWRPSTGDFYILNSFDSTFRSENFGLAGDVPTGGDFDGDGKADIAVYRPGTQGTFYYRASLGNPQGNITFLPWGASGDKPVVGDYDGDGLTDAAIYRPSNGTWYIRRSSTGQLLGLTFGLSDDVLVPADYDSDGKTDVAVFRNGSWYLLRSTQGFAAFQLGVGGDTPAPADYDGDGRADAAVFRAGVWWIMKSQSGMIETLPFGASGDQPIAAAFVR